MSSRLPWRHLVPGLIAVGLMAAATIALIVYGGIGRLDGDTVRLHIVTNQARGLIKGSDVWLGGQRVGAVVDMSFLPPTSDTTRRLVVHVDVLEEAADRIRKDSEVRIRAGGNVIGPVIVDVTPGTPAGARVGDGDTLRAEVQSDFELAGAKLAVATADVGPLMTDAKAVLRQFRDTSGTIGAALSGSAGGSITRLRATMARSGGDERRGASPATVMARARVAMARADSIRALVASPATSLGRFKRDSTLGAAIGSARDELAELSAMMRESGGTAERLGSDSALVRSVAAAQREMAELFADVKRRPLRYIAF